MTLKLITAPTEEPVTLDEAKLHCKVEFTTDDALLTLLIAAARQEAEQYLQRALVTQTWERVLDAFPGGSGVPNWGNWGGWSASGAEIELGMPPVQSIVSVTYIDTHNITQTMSTSAYSLDTDTEPGWVLPAINTTWPDTLDTADAVRVRFVAGYGNAAAVPAAIKAWIKVRVGSLYKVRESVLAGERLTVTAVTEMVPTFFDSLLDTYRFYG